MPGWNGDEAIHHQARDKGRSWVAMALARERSDTGRWLYPPRPPVGGGLGGWTSEEGCPDAGSPTYRPSRQANSVTASRTQAGWLSILLWKDRWPTPA